MLRFARQAVKHLKILVIFPFSLAVGKEKLCVNRLLLQNFYKIRVTNPADNRATDGFKVIVANNLIRPHKIQRNEQRSLFFLCTELIYSNLTIFSSVEIGTHSNLALFQDYELLCLRFYGNLPRMQHFLLDFLGNFQNCFVGEMR